MAQKEFAKLIKISTPTIERWEASDKKITGPVIFAVNFLKAHPEYVESISIPEKKLPIRMWYMFKNDRCTLIDVDQAKQKIEIKNYTDNLMFRAFGKNENPSYKDFSDFLEERTMPKSRDKLKLELDNLEIPFYDPLLIIRKTKGRMAEDNFWIEM